MAVLLDNIDFNIKSTANDRDYHHGLKRGSVDPEGRTVLICTPATQLQKLT